MNWFNLKELEDKLQKKEVSEKTGFQYLLTWSIFVSIAFYVPDDSSYSGEWWDFSDFILDLAISIGGIILAYRINKNGENSEFLKRFLSLSFVHSIRLVLFVSLLALIFKIVMFVIPIELYLAINGFIENDLSHLISSLCISLIFYFFLIRSFKRLNNRKFQAARSTAEV